MADEDDPSKRSTAPKNASDWSYLWDGASKGRQAWPVTGPIIAVVRNWKALAVVGVLVVWFNRPEIISAISTLLGMEP